MNSAKYTNHYLWADSHLLPDSGSARTLPISLRLLLGSSLAGPVASAQFFSILFFYVSQFIL